MNDLKKIELMIKHFTAFCGSFNIEVFSREVSNLRNEKREENIVSSKVRASMLGGCPLEVVYYMNGKAPKHEDFMLNAFNEGTVIHRLFQSYCEPYFDRIEPYFENERLTGHIDGIVGRTIVEIKSASVIPDRVPERYLYQVGAYFELTGLDRAVFIFIDKKDFSNIKTFLFKNSPQIRSMLDEKLSLIYELNTKFQKGDLSLEEMEKVATTDKCKFCGYKEVCDVQKQRLEQKIFQLENFIGQKILRNPL